MISSPVSGCWSDVLHLSSHVCFRSSLCPCPVPEFFLSVSFVFLALVCEMGFSYLPTMTHFVEFHRFSCPTARVYGPAAAYTSTATTPLSGCLREALQRTIGPRRALMHTNTLHPPPSAQLKASRSRRGQRREIWNSVCFFLLGDWILFSAWTEAV